MTNTRKTALRGEVSMTVENAAYASLSPRVRELLREAPYDFLSTDALTIIEDFGEEVFVRNFRALCADLVTQRARAAYGPSHPQARAA